ncbi:MAG: hypothetical protein OJI67_07815 [Prosthecobacter sp.]|nr:hypothetical protein [Prosthecobacter sp.]
MPPANLATLPTQATSFRIAAKKRLLELGISVTGLARQLNLARNTVSVAINHESMHPTVKNRIREVLKLYDY